MKIVFLLLGVGLFSLQAVSAEGDKKSSDRSGDTLETVSQTVNFKPGHKAKTEWLNRLNDNTKWRKRLKAVEDWRTVDWSRPNDSDNTFSHLELRLSDRSRKVREAVVTAFEEMGMEMAYHHFRPYIAGALAKQVPNDTESLFLRKMQVATEIFNLASLYTFEHPAAGNASILWVAFWKKDFPLLEHPVAGNTAVLLELEDSGFDEVFTALYEMAEKGMSNKQNAKIRWAAFNLLDIIVEKVTKSLARGPFQTSKVEGQFSDLILKGLKVAAMGLADKNLTMRSLVKNLLENTLKSRNFSDTQVSRIILSVAKGGFSHSDYKIRKGTIKWLLEISKRYPSLGTEVASILQKRRKQESSQKVKKAIKNALTQLSGLKKPSTCQDHLA